MNPRWAAGRNVDERSTWNPRLNFYLASLIVASVGVLLAGGPAGPVLGAVLVASVAMLGANCALTASRGSSTGRRPAASSAEDGMTSFEGRYLNLAGESPTFRSIVEVIPAGTLTAAPRRHKRPGLLRAHRMVFLAAVLTAMIGWLTAPSGASAARTMTILMTGIAVLSFVVVLATGEGRPWRSLSGDSECNAETKYFYPTTEAKVELDARFEGARPKGRRE
jgi:hypothetical protein